MASIDAIEGIGHKDATSLRKARIRTTEALLKTGGTRKGRKAIADTTDISEKLILEWVNRADLFRVKGIGEEYSDLLEASGVPAGAIFEAPWCTLCRPDLFFSHRGDPSGAGRMLNCIGWLP